MRKLTVLFVLAGLVLSACQAAPGTPGGASGEWPDRLVLGLVPSREADVLIENAEPLTDHLSEVLSEMAGKTITVEGFVPQDYTGLVAAMETGQAHIGAFGPFSLLQARDRAGAEIVLQSVRFGSATYHTQWFTSADNADKYCDDEPVADSSGRLGCNGTATESKGPLGEDALANIEPGTTVAFVEQSSASGYIFPALMLIEAGLDHETDIEPIFSGGHDNSVLAVYNGDAEVGVSFDDARSIVEEEFPDVGQTVVTFAFSTEIPNDGWVVAGDLPDDLKEAITQALLDYSASEEGKEVLDSIYEITELVRADESSFEVVERAARELGVTGD
ncbi:MAG: phosphate/phosphite/phosphonate ABC transporter substrate-binding protein [Candidatus Limnocylindria bacterium]